MKLTRCIACLTSIGLLLLVAVSASIGFRQMSPIVAVTMEEPIPRVAIRDIQTTVTIGNFRSTNLDRMTSWLLVVFRPGL